jgi:hypothetical protein
MGVALAALPAIAAVAGIAGAGVSAYGAYETGQATSASDAYQAQVAANNAALAKQQSKLDIQSGEIQAVDQGLKTKATVGQEKAAQGASGIDPNAGSAVDVRAGTAEMGMVDSLTVRSNAVKKAYGDEVTAASDTAQGQLDTMGATQAETAGDIGAAGTLLSGASTVGSNYAKFQNSFGTNGAAPTQGLAGIGAIS